jgi:hypothetical protein
MAGNLSRRIFGGEAGDNSGLSSFSGSPNVVGDGTARTGDFYLKILKATASSGVYFELAHRVTIVSTSGGGVNGLIRSYIRCRAYPSVSGEVILMFGAASGRQFAMEMDTAGHFRAYAMGTTSSYSTNPIPLSVNNAWTEVVLSAVFNDNPSGNDQAICTVTVTGVEIVSATNNAPAAGPCTLAQAHFGGHVLTSCTVETDYDDIVMVAGSDDERTNAVLPAETRISPVRVTAQGASADWTGDYRNVTDVPVYGGVLTDQNSGTNGASTTLKHGTVAQLKLGTIRAVAVYANAYATVGSQQHALLWDGVESLFTLITSQPAGDQVPTIIDWRTGLGSWTSAQFDAAEMGFRNKTGTATVRLASITAEVLHNGTTVADPYAGGGSWKQGGGVFSGNGAFQAIAHGLGAVPHVIMLKKASGGSGSAGTFWNARLGGTRSKAMEAPMESIGIMGADATYFYLGPSIHANSSGSQFQWFAVRDGGGSPEGYYLDFGVMVGTGLQHSVKTPRAFQPELMLHFGSMAIHRDTDSPANESMQLTNTVIVLNMLQAFNADGFLIGTSNQANGVNVQYPYVVFRRGAMGKLSKFFAWGSFVPSGGTYSVTGLQFAPAFVFGDRVSVQDACWRGTSVTVHTGTSGGQWGSNALTTTGFTAMNADGFTVGSQLSVNGERTYWVAALAAGEVDISEATFENAKGDPDLMLAWVERLDSASTLHLAAKVALPDPLIYYGGYKADRVISWGKVRRALSDRDGQYEGADFTWIESDTDRQIRSQLGAESTKFFRGRPITVRMISDAGRRQLLVPRTVVKGLISAYKPLSPLHFEFTAQDILSRKFSPQNTKDQIPYRVVSTDDFPNCPPGQRDLPVPIIYGEISDRNQVTETVPGSPTDNPPGWPRRAVPAISGLTATPYGSFSGNVTRVYAITQQNVVYSYLRTDGQPPYVPPWEAPGWSPADHRGESEAVWITVPGCPTDEEIIAGGGSVGVEVRWHDDGDPLAWAYKSPRPFNGSDFYRVYGRSEGLVKLLDFADVGFGEQSPVYYEGKRPYGKASFNVLKMDGDPPSTNYSLVDGNPSAPGTTITTDTGVGVVPAIPVGPRTLSDGNEWQEFLICGHAIKAILAWYVDGVRQSDTTEGTDTDKFLMPGFAGYISVLGTVPYVDYNGHRYAVCYARGSVADQLADGSKKLTLNLQGIEDVGDGTGTVITDLLLQYRHCLVNWLLQSYQSGGWLATPVFSDDADLTQIDEASFDAASNQAKVRVDGGYIGAFMLGSGNERLTIRDTVARLNISADADCGFNRKMQFFVSMQADTISAGATALTDERDIIGGSFDIEDRLDDLFNAQPFTYARDYAGISGKDWLQTAEVQDDVSITGIGEKLVAKTAELHCVRDGTVAQDVAQRRLIRTKEPPRYVRMRVGLGGANLELGDIITVTHYEGISGSGWTDWPMRITRHELDPDQLFVDLEAYDMQRLFEGAFILGDEGALPASWTSATAAERRYGYLCDETTGLFSDGAKGKRLR